MKPENYEMLLDSLQIAAIYVIREDDHRILYFNKRVKDIMPSIELGMVCHELMAGFCSNCPLLSIEGKKESRTINYNNPFGKAVDIVASRILWGDIPAFSIAITSHVDAVSFTYDKILRVNLESGAFDLVQVEKEAQAKALSTISTLPEWIENLSGKGDVYGSDVARVRKFGDLAYLRQELARGRQVLTCTYRRRQGKEYRWYMMEIVPSFDYADEGQFAMLYIKDVHDVYREGLELEEANIQNREIINSLGEMNFGVYLINLDTGISNPVRVSERMKDAAFTEIMAWDDALERLVDLFFHPDSREKLMNSLTCHALARGWEKGGRKEILSRYLSEGKYRHVSITAHFYEGGRKERNVVLALLDVDERIREEKKRNQDDRRMAAIIRSGYDIMNSVDLDTGKCQRIMLKADNGKEKIWTGDYEYYIQKAADEWIHKEDAERFRSVLSIENLRKNAAKTQDFSQITCQFRFGEEEIKWVEEQLFFIRQDNTVMVNILSRDVTESKEKEEREHMILKDAYEVALHASATKSDFLSRMSHDIRTPMNAIIGMTAIAGSHLDDREKVAECLNKITAASNHLLSLVNEILDMSKIETGKIDLSEEEFTLSELLQDVITTIRPEAAAKQHELKFHVKLEHEDVVGDVMRLRQVFINILDNGVKYTPPGGKLELEIVEKESQDFGYGCYEFTFKDNGIGMPPEFVKKIFEPFSRAEDSRISKIEGTGLGMTIAQNIIKMMNGDIVIDSREGGGTRVAVTVFLKQQSTEIADMKKYAGRKVLVVDDDQDSCEVVCDILADMEIDSRWTQSGREAVRLVGEAEKEKEGYFAVILDWKMPDMDGVETAKAIRKEAGDQVKIIMLSGYDWSDVEEEVREAGVDGFLSKPLFKSRLVYLLKKIASEDTAEEKEEVGTMEEAPFLPDFSGKRILLTEDNELNREIAMELIGCTGAAVECAVDGKQGVEKFAEKEEGYYDLIFMDIQMPVMNGHEATRAIRNLKRKDAGKIPIIALTANAYTEDVIASRKAGMNEHMTKPLMVEKLMECMARWLK